MASTVSDRHIAVAVCLLSLLYAVLAVRLAQVQCFRDTPDDASPPTLVHIPQQRGHILDRDGIPLTCSHRYCRYFLDAVALDPSNQWTVVTNVAVWFPGTDAAALDRKLAANRGKGRRYEVVGASADTNLEATVRALIDPARADKTFHGVGIEECFEREYPLGAETSHIVGFINKQNVGVAGIEMRYNETLRGEPGHKWASYDARRREIRHLRDGYRPPRNGCDIELTIDSALQHYVDAALDGAWRQTGSLAAWALVYDCRTGEILAMADRPSVDPVHYGEDQESWRNLCVAFRYEPGSVMKPVTLCGALTAGVITENSTFDTGHGPLNTYGRPLRDHFDGVGRPADFIRRSSNKGTALIAMRMGAELLYKTLHGAGFGEKTGVELPAENPGNLRPWEKWIPLNVTRICIGQSVDVTAIQLACAYGAIANGGIRMRPHIVRRILAPESHEVLRDFHPEPVPEASFSPKAAAAMLRMLEGVVAGDPETGERGTGRRAAVRGFRVGGKTGTAQMLVHGAYSSTDYHASFCGILPIDNPRYVIIVTLQRPVGKLHGGGDVAAPLFSEIATLVAQHYRLPTDLDQVASISPDEPYPDDPEGLLDPDASRDYDLSPELFLPQP